MAVPAPGEQYAGCRILSVCGHGGMGIVYLAEDAIGRRVALKVIALTDSRRELQGIRNYMRVSAGKKHLIQIFHAGVEREMLFYVMEAADPLEGDWNAYVPKTLSNLLEHRGRMMPQTALQLIRALADGLSELHKKKLLHRDVKPENIIFVNGIPKLCDPGLVCSMEASASFAGTLGYLPQECFNGENLNVPGRDVYALGKVFYTAVTGELPARYPHMPPDLGFAVRRQLWPVLIRVCDPTPSHRFRTAEEFASALPETLPDPSRLEQMLESFRQWKLVHPHQSLLLHLFLLLLILGTAAGISAGIRYATREKRYQEECAENCRVRKARAEREREQISAQLEGDAGPAERKRWEKIFSVSGKPSEQWKLFRDTDARLQELAGKQLRKIPEGKISAEEADALSISQRRLLESPLGQYLPENVRKEQLKRIRAMERKMLDPLSSGLRKGESFSPDSTQRRSYRYIPAGVFRDGKGKIVRVAQDFWCCDAELTISVFQSGIRADREEVPNPERPAVRFLWNELLDFCRRMTLNWQERNLIPRTWILRPMTSSEWLWACRGAWKGMGNPTVFTQKNTKGRRMPVRSGDPNSMMLYDMLGNVAEMTLPDGKFPNDGDVLEVRGGHYLSRKADAETVEAYPAYQQLPLNVGARLAIVRGSMDYFEKAFWTGKPRIFRFGGKVYALLTSHDARLTRRQMKTLCALLGGHMARVETPELLQALPEYFQELLTLPAFVDGNFKNGKWVQADGKEFKQIPMPKPPETGIGSLVIWGPKLRCLENRCSPGLLCEWENEESFRKRTDRGRILCSPLMLHSFRIGKKRYCLIRYDAHPHNVRALGLLLGGRAAELHTKTLRKQILTELKEWKEKTILLGGVRKYGKWVFSDGKEWDEELPLQGKSFHPSLYPAAPGIFKGKYCALQRTELVLLEFPEE